MTRDWAALAANPIQPDKPCGDSILYDPSYEAIKMEMARLEALRPKMPDWKFILDRSAEILQEKSKDLTVAAFLVLALFQEYGYSGLAQGLNVCRILTTYYWDDLFPEVRRMRGRAAAFSWLNDRVRMAV